MKRSSSSTSSREWGTLWKTKSEEWWMREGARRALRVFHETAQVVPAYKDFLKKAKIREERIKTIRDFELVPPTTKKNYIEAYDLPARLPKGILQKETLMAVSSGTSGEPVFWPRGKREEEEAVMVHQVLFGEWYRADTIPTLCIVGFPVGMYVSGLATVLPLEKMAEEGYPVTVVGVGNKKEELLRILKELGPRYPQVVIAAHPFFLKDVLETARERGIPIPPRLRGFLCSEGISEEWRTYVAKEAGLVSTFPLFSTYGSSELLLMGYESPWSIMMRKSKAFHEGYTKRFHAPSLFQFNPTLRYIESVQGELLFTAASGVPLIRYNMKDSGEVISGRVLAEGTGVKAPKGSWQLPFVTLHGRSDRTLIFYAANIYPEHIKAGIEHPTLMKHITGKFVMEKKETGRLEQTLEIHIELRDGIKESKKLSKTITERVLKTLLQLNAEYKDTSLRMGKDLKPRITLLRYQDPKKFPPGVKPKYIHS